MLEVPDWQFDGDVLVNSIAVWLLALLQDHQQLQETQILIDAA